MPSSARRVSVVWYPARLAPHDAARFRAALEGVAPRADLSVRLARGRDGWTVTHACEGDWKTAPRPTEHKAAAAWALRRAGLIVGDCPVCGDPVDAFGTESRETAVREHGVAPEHGRRSFYAHRYSTACTAPDFWARFSLPCACGERLRFVVKAAEAVEGGGELTCRCGARYALEPRASGAGVSIEPT
jgi:hypothetical protein